MNGQTDPWGDDEWHTDEDGQIIGGAPPSFVFVAKSTLEAALAVRGDEQDRLAEAEKLLKRWREGYLNAREDMGIVPATVEFLAARVALEGDAERAPVEDTALALQHALDTGVWSNRELRPFRDALRAALAESPDQRSTDERR